jgi:hypothetical protein
MRHTKQIKNDTQQKRLLSLLQERGDRGVYVYEIQTPRPQGLGIAQYNTRISELREKGHDIVNVVPGHFVLGETVSKPQQQPLKPTTEAPKWESFTNEDGFPIFMEDSA